MLEIIRRWLARSGYQVLTAADGPDAVVAAVGHHVDVVLADIRLPGMSGREAADLIRTVRPDVKVLYMSGYTDTGGDLICKPFTEEVLLARLAEVGLGGRW